MTFRTFGIIFRTMDRNRIPAAFVLALWIWKIDVVKYLEFGDALDPELDL